MKFLQFAVGTVERAVTAGFADNMIASYSLKAIQRTVSVVQRKDILLSPVISEIRYDFPQRTPSH